MNPNTHTQPRPAVTRSSLCIFTVDCTVWIVTKQTAVWAFMAGRVRVCPHPLPSLFHTPSVGLTFQPFHLMLTSDISFWIPLNFEPSVASLEGVYACGKGHRLRPEQASLWFSVELLLSIRVYLSVCVKDSFQGQVSVLEIAIVYLLMCVPTDLPHSNDGICNEDEEDDKGLDKGRDSFLTFLEHSQHLVDRKYISGCKSSVMSMKFMTFLPSTSDLQSYKTEESSKSLNTWEARTVLVNV